MNHDIAPGLREALDRLGDEYGPMGVALAAADRTDRTRLMDELQNEAIDDEMATGDKPAPEPTVTLTIPSEGLYEVPLRGIPQGPDPIPDDEADHGATYRQIGDNVYIDVNEPPAPSVPRRVAYGVHLTPEGGIAQDRLTPEQLDEIAGDPPPHLVHATRELAILRARTPDVDADDFALHESLVAAVRAFHQYGHSGGSVGWGIDTLTRLLRMEPLSELTDDPDEWIDQSPANGGEPLWQNVRDSAVFNTEPKVEGSWSVNDTPGPVLETPPRPWIEIVHPDDANGDGMGWEVRLVGPDDVLIARAKGSTFLTALGALVNRAGRDALEATLRDSWIGK